MNSISLYTPYWSSFGGGEKYLLMMAEVLSQLNNTAVTLLTNDARVEKSELERFFGVNLSKIILKFVHGGLREIKSIPKNTDVFVCLSNFRKVETSARTAVQLLQIPYGKITAGSVLGKLFNGKPKEAVKDFYRLQLHAYSRNRATIVITNSQFVHDILSNNFGIESRILYPPIQDFHIEGVSKKNIILSVGRFFSGLYNQKRYDILTEAFRSVSRTGLDGWEYHLIGSFVSDPASQKMLETLRMENRNFPVVFHLNEPYESLRHLYNEATIFWHAAGFGVDEANHPENVEHFGMTTVEAMSAGCIPIVINKGGQKEIVQHGVNGFLWNSVEELIEQTIAVAERKIAGLQEMRENARKRYEDFDTEHFRQRVIELFSPLVSN